MKLVERICAECGKTFEGKPHRREKYCQECEQMIAEQKLIERNAQRRAQYREECAWRKEMKAAKLEELDEDLRQERMQRGERKCLTEDAVNAKKKGLSYGEYMAIKHAANQEKG